MPTYSHSQRLNVLGFLSRQGKLIYHLTMTTNSTEVVIEAFDRLFSQKSPGAFAIVVLDNASAIAPRLSDEKAGLDIASYLFNQSISLFAEARFNLYSLEPGQV